MKKQVLVINYHAIIPDDEPASGTIDAVFSVSRNSFEKQIEILLKHNIPIVPLHDLVNNSLTADFSVAITSDDGNASDCTIIYPLLKSHSIPATFFWLSYDLENNFNMAAAKEMVMNGFTIGSHGISHRDMTRMGPTEQSNDLDISKKELEEKTGNPVNYFAFPYGAYTGEIFELVKKSGYAAACGSELKLNCAGDGSFLIHRWNIKKNTSHSEFEKMLTDPGFLRHKIKISRVKNAAKKILGKSIADRLNLLFNS